MSRRVALYVRVSTVDQITENQERELTSIAARMGWMSIGAQNRPLIGVQC